MDQQQEKVSSCLATDAMEQESNPVVTLQHRHGTSPLSENGRWPIRNYGYRFHLTTTTQTKLEQCILVRSDTPTNLPRSFPQRQLTGQPNIKALPTLPRATLHHAWIALVQRSYPSRHKLPIPKQDLIISTRFSESGATPCKRLGCTNLHQAQIGPASSCSRRDCEEAAVGIVELATHCLLPI